MMNEIKTCLMIGGPKDGERHFFPESMREIEVIVAPESPFNREGADLEAGVEIQRVAYRREYLQGGETLFSVWLEKKTSTEQALRNLLENYRPKQEGNS